MPLFTSKNGVHTSNGSLTLSEKEGVISVRTMLFIPLLQHEDTRPFTCSRTFQSLYHTFTAMGLDPWAALWSCWWLARKTQQHKLGQCTHVPSLVSSSMHRRQQWLAEFHCFIVGTAPTTCSMQLSLDTQVAKMVYCKNWRVTPWEGKNDLFFLLQDNKISYYYRYRNLKKEPTTVTCTS